MSDSGWRAVLELLLLYVRERRERATERAYAIEDEEKRKMGMTASTSVAGGQTGAELRSAPEVLVGLELDHLHNIILNLLAGPPRGDS